MKRSNTILVGLAAAVSLGLATAYAHPGPGGEGWGPGMMGYGGYGMVGGPHGGPGMKGGRFGGNPAAAIETHLGTLKSDLKITSAQEPAWKKFADAAKQHGETMAKIRGQAQAPQSAPERMAQRTEIMKQQLAGMERTNGAFKQLYAALTPEQKAVADREVGPFHGPGFGRGHWGR
jgi:hypothetical protein